LQRFGGVIVAIALVPGGGGESDEPIPSSTDDMPAIVAEFNTAYESGDIEQIRALYVDDGILISTDDMHAIFYGDTSYFGLLGLDGSEFVRRASINSGEMEIYSPVAVGEKAVSFGWAWADFASGTATLHLRDGRIALAVLTVTEVEIDPPPSI
jgi:hypothetical protein